MTVRLTGLLEKKEKVDLGNLFEYLQGIAEGLQEIIRWEAREKIAGQSVRENDLQHTFKTTFLTIICAAAENAWRFKYGLLPFGKCQLDIGMLATMALIHDVGEIMEGDTARFEKVKNYESLQRNEFLAFERMIAPLAQETREYFLEAFKRTMFGSPLCIKDREALFFNAVENLIHLKRALHECRLGNLHFAPKCLEEHIEALQKYAATEFPSLKNWYEPFIKEAEDYLKSFKAKREEYIAAFIKRGGNEEEFPF